MSEVEIKVDLGLEGAYETTGDEVFKSEENRTACAEYVSQRIIDARDGAERKELVTRWETWRRQRMVRPAQSTKNTPWPNAANTVTTKTATNTNVMFGKLKTMIQGRDPRMVCRARKEEFQPHARALQDLFNFVNASPLHVNLPEKDRTILYEAPSMGTQVVDMSWDSKRMHRRAADAGGKMVPVDKTVFEGPMPDPVLLDQFLFPQGYTDLQTMPWCGFDKNYLGYQLKQLQQLGFFRDVEIVEGAAQTELRDFENQMANRMGLKPLFSVEREERYVVTKVYVQWDTDDDGITDDLVLWVHAETKTILRAEYNLLGKRPIVRFPFINVPGQFYGMGIGWLSELGQEELDTWRNIRINSTILSSLNMLAVRRGGLLKSDETLKPGKFLQVNDPNGDIKPIGFLDTSGSTLQAEIVASREIDTAVAMSDVARGGQDQVAKSGTSTSLQMMQLRQGDSIFESVSADIRDAYSELYLLQLEMCVVNSQRAVQWMLPLVKLEDQAYVKQVFEMPLEDVPYAFAFEMETTPLSETKEMQRQTVMTKIQLFSMYTQEILQLLQMMTSGMPAGPGMPPQSLPPQMQEFIMQAMLTKHKLMEEALSAMGSTDAEDLVGYYKDLEVMRSMIEAQKDAQIAQMKMQAQGGMTNVTGTGNPGMGSAAGGVAGSGGMVPGTGSGGVPPAAGAPQAGMAGDAGQTAY